MFPLRNYLLAAALVAAFPSVALAQQAPDAGQTLQQQQQLPPQLPRAGASVDIQPLGGAAAVPGGPEVRLTSIVIVGATVFSETELLALLGDAVGKSYDLVGLRDLSDRISAHYLNSGYPFARAYLPQQALADGKLIIEVVEGRYGQVRALGDQALAARAAGFLSSLRPGDVIASAPLERATLLLDDKPGIKVAPIIRPGQEIGTGDLDVRLDRTSRVSGDVGLDNHGNRFTGEHRVSSNLQLNSPFTLGDQLSARLLYSDENMWLGSLNYGLPLGGSGLRGTVGYAHTYYELAKNFAALGATGKAKVSSLGLTYPVIRSQTANITLALTYFHKELNDKQQVAKTDDDKYSDSLPIALNFDRRDVFLGGGVTYGSIAYTTGKLDLGADLEKTDRSSGQNTRGRFDKFNLDIARLQATPVDNLVLFGRFSSQWAGKNLDSSEGFMLGGASGVRAYPSGEGNGDEGWLMQIELRYTLGSYTPYVFYDNGKVTLNAENTSLKTPAKPNHRSISGEGFGLRYTGGDWNIDANLAWRNHGGVPQSDTADRRPRVWVSLGYRF